MAEKKTFKKTILIILGIFIFLFFLFSLFLAGLGALISAFIRPTAQYEVVGEGRQIAIVELKGIILDAEETVSQIKKYREDKDVKAIVFRIDSPGGAVVPSQEIYEEVKKTRDSGKPVVVSMGTVAASGGYYVALGASKIMANQGTVTGSVGVITQILHFEGLMKKIGIGETTIKSGALKDAGTWSRSMRPQEQKYFQMLLDNIYHQFRETVKKERKLQAKQIEELADGRVFTGEQALKLRLVDGIGTFEDSIALASNLAGIKGKIAIVRKRRAPRYIDLLIESLKDKFVEALHELSFGSLIQYRLEPR